MNIRCYLILQSLIVLSSSDTRKYVLEVLAVLDKSTIDKWMENSGTLEKVHEEVRSMFVEINDIWKSLKTYGLHVEVRLLNTIMWNKDIITAKDGAITKNVDPDLALEAFENWVKERSDSFDHAMYLTDSDMGSTGLNVVMGYAYIGTVCERQALSVVKATTGYRTIVQAGHELGHSLGSVHDGEGNECEPGSEYLMSPKKTPKTKNKWFFSSCSAKQIKEKLRNLRPNCLSSRHTTAEPVLAPRLGELLDADEQCRRFLGTYLSRSFYKTYDDNLCTQLWCHHKYVNKHYYWMSIEMAEGTPCGKGKRCFRGRCVIVSNGNATMSDHCPYGDAPILFDEEGETCSDIASLENKCSQKFWQRICCHSCKT